MTTTDARQRVFMFCLFFNCLYEYSFYDKIDEIICRTVSSCGEASIQCPEHGYERHSYDVRCEGITAITILLLYFLVILLCVSA